MPKLNQRGAIQFIVLLILLAGVVGGVLLVTRGEPLKLLPRAVSGPINVPQTSFSLAAQKTNYNIGEEVEVKLLVRLDIDPANLFAAKINYDPSFLRLGRVDVTSFVTNWVEQYWGDPGKISLVGGVLSPGLQTQTNSAPAKMVSLYFTALKAGSTTVSFDDTSAIYRNSDNLNILGPKNGVTITIGTATATSPVPTSTPSPTPIATPKPPSTLCTLDQLKAAFGTKKGDPKFNPNCDLNNDGQIDIVDFSKMVGLGDANKDGKVDLIDLSILLTDFNKTQGIRAGIDLNGDGVINTLDFSLMRNLLIQKGVIRG